MKSDLKRCRAVSTVNRSTCGLGGAATDAAGSTLPPPRSAILQLSRAILCSRHSLGNYFFDSRYFREDNRGAGAYLSGNAAIGDLVFAHAPYTALNLEYYARRPDLTVVGYPTPIPMSDVLRLGRGAPRRRSRCRNDLPTHRYVGAAERDWQARSLLGFLEPRVRRLSCA